MYCPLQVNVINHALDNTTRPENSDASVLYCTVYSNVNWTSEDLPQIWIYKVPETHGHVKQVTLYRLHPPPGTSSAKMEKGVSV